MFDKAKQLWKLQAEAKKIQAELREMHFDGVELGGKVRVVVNGEQKVEEIHIDDSLLDPSEKESLSRFLKQAIGSAIGKSQQAAAQKMKSIAGDLGMGGF
jgi:DNA-binding YbaB/EbfC family protein